MSCSLDHRFLASAIDIVLHAGEIQLSRFGSALRIDKKGTIDLVTEADLEVEAMFRRTIAERFPSHDVLAEESGGTHPAGPPATASSSHCWVFDPIDGTTNFAHGLPIFCSALALEIDGVVSVAAVYDPTRRELFTAERGGGAYVNGNRLRTSSTLHLVDAALVTGFPYDVHERAGEIVELFGAFVARARAVRRLGSAALDLCYVASGRLDGFWEEGLRPWDVAAASLVVSEAGGRVSGLDGAPFRARGGHVLATNGLIHEQMLTVVASVRAVRARNRTE
ncbi:MAG: inositol monophosphatase family protein [Acidobacteriota bacterium]